MSIKTLIIFNSPILFEILEEIKENLHFEIVAATEDEISQRNFRKSNDHVIVSCQANDIKECKIINTPIKLDKILEQINTFFLGNKFSS